MNLNQDTKPEEAFYCADGAVLKNLRGLAEKLKTISPDAHKHHANEYKNDFRNWIRDVYGNKKLAETVASAKSSAEASAIIEKAIAPHQKKKPSERKKSAPAERKPARRRRKPYKQMKKSASSSVAAKKKEKKSPTKRIRKRRKTKRKPAKRKITLHKMVHSHLKRVARQLGFL